MSKSSVYFFKYFIYLYIFSDAFLLFSPLEFACRREVQHLSRLFCPMLGLRINTYRAQKSPTLQHWDSNVSNGCFIIFCSSCAQGEGKVIDCCSPQTARLKGKDTEMQFIMHVDISGHWNVLRMKNKHKSLNIKMLERSILLDGALRGEGAAFCSATSPLG